MKTFYISVLVLFQFIFTQAQGPLFVKAEKGLTVRVAPNINAQKKGTFYYGDHVIQLLPVKDSITIQENGKKLKGAWLLVSGDNEKQENIQGYVFSGFLANNYIPKPTVIPFKKGVVKIYNTSAYFDLELSKKNKVTMLYAPYDIGYGESIDLKIDFPDAKNIEVYQRLDATIAYQVHDIDCEILRKNIIKSNWEILAKKGNRFTTINYNNGQEAQEELILKAWSQIKDNVKTNCLESYYKIQKNLYNERENPIGVHPNFVSFKIVITNKDGSQTIKQIDVAFYEGC